MPTIMSAARARGTRLTQLAADVEAGARCAQPDAPFTPDEWFREDGESLALWRFRRKSLLSFCQGCPVLAQCREMALRQDATGWRLDMVRGGMTDQHIAKIRKSDKHRDSIDRAILADQAPTQADQERHRLNTATLTLQRAAAACSSHTSGTWQEENNRQVREAAAKLAKLRAARRRNNGWAAPQSVETEAAGSVGSAAA